MKKNIPQSEMCNSKFKNGNIDEALFNVKWIQIINLSEKSKVIVHKNGGQ